MPNHCIAWINAELVSIGLLRKNFWWNFEILTEAQLFTSLKVHLQNGDYFASSINDKSIEGT